MIPPRALLLAAGLGTRLRPRTATIPKCLVPVGGRPLLDYWLMALADAGVREILINTHHLPEPVREYIARVNAAGGQLLSETYEPHLRGSAGTIAHNRAFADAAEEIVVIYADNFSDVSIADLLACHRRHPDPVTMLLFRTERPQDCGIVELDPDARVTRFVEKPARPASDLANAGVYVLDADVYREIADAKRFDLGHHVLPHLTGRMRGWIHDGYHRDLGTTTAYERVRADAPAVNVRRGMDAQGRRPAVFFDRDGVLIEHVHYLTDPDGVRLSAGAARAVMALRRAGYACVVASNQSAIGRGLLTEAGLQAINDRMCSLFAAEGAVFDALYHCPVAPALTDRTIVEHVDRKPGPGMLLRAAQDLGLDLSRSWMIGDAVSDVLAGLHAGCRGSILVESQASMASAALLATIPHVVADDLAGAAETILQTASIAS
jgi:histidinol-phosphate phosphatase family protein